MSGGILGVVQQLFTLGLGLLFHSKDRGRLVGRVVVVARGWRSPDGDDNLVSSLQAFTSLMDRIDPIWMGLSRSDLGERGVVMWVDLADGDVAAGVGIAGEVPTGVQRDRCNPLGRFGFVGSEIWSWALAWVRSGLWLGPGLGFCSKSPFILVILLSIVILFC